VNQAATAPVTPLALFENLNAYQRTAALKTALDLEIFTAIADGATDPPSIADACGASPKGVRVLCDYLAIFGLLTKSGGRYGLPPDSATFLVRHSPAYLGGIREFMLSAHLTDNFLHLTEAVRKGGTALNNSVAPEHPMWVTFAHAMAPLMRGPAEALAALAEATGSAPARVLDIAAGHGLFGIAMAKRFPQAEVTALDWPHVLDVARENARDAGVDRRHHTIAGSAFEAAFVGPYDVVLLTNFLHHFDAGTCESLLRKIHASMRPGGRVITLEFVPEEDRLRPTMSAAFALMMLAGTESGDAYTFAELAAMFTAAGFARSEQYEVPMSVQAAVVSYR
jgi:2-polyprenyl-3-methyl-5-hydroxy-6-metoxy-1,4-benzoquinol methylase